MDIRIRMETLGIRFRSLFKTLVRIAGIGLVLLGVYNMFLVGLLDMSVIAPYRQWGLIFTGKQSAYYLGDVLVMAVGAIIAWFV